MTRHQTRLVAVVGLLAGVSTIALGVSAAGVVAAGTLRGSLARLPGVDITAVEVDPWSGIATLRKLSVRSGASRLSAANVRFHLPSWPSLALVSPAHAAGENVSAENVVLDYAGSTVRIPKIEATGTSLSKEALAKIFDPKDTTSLSERVQALNADRIFFPEITVDRVSPQFKQHIVYKNFSMDQISKGKASRFGQESANFDGSIVQLKGGFTGTIGSMHGRNLDLLGYARFVNEVRKDPDEPLRSLYEDVTIDSASFKGSDFEVKIGKMFTDKFMVRPLTVALSQLQASITAPSGQSTKPEQQRKTFVLLADLYDSMAFGTLDLNDISARFGADEQRGVLHLSHVGIRGFAHAQLAGMALDGFALKAKAADVTIGSLALQNLDFRPGLAAMKAATDRSALATANPRQFISTIGRLTLTNIGTDFRVPGGKGNSEDGKRVKFSFGKFEFNGSNYQLGIPATASVDLEHLVFDLPKLDPNSQPLIALGYNSVDLSSIIDYAWNEADSSLTMKKFNFLAAGMSSLNLSASFGNVTKDLFVGDAAVAQAALLGTNIKALDTRYDNFGIFDKLLEQVARQNDKSIDAVRQETANQFETSARQLLGDTPQTKSIIEAVVTFIKVPKSLEVKATSAKGVSAADAPLLQSPAEFVKRLNITATANQ